MSGAVTIVEGENLVALAQIAPGSVRCVVTSPPYNLGASPSAESHRTSAVGRFINRGYGDDDPDKLPEPVYQAQQRALLDALYRVCADGANVFYNHKDRLWDGNLISPLQWLPGPFNLRQIIVWDRKSTHNHSGYYFHPEHEYVFWLKKGTTHDHIGTAASWGSVWTLAPESGAEHPFPFPVSLAERCILAGSVPGDVVLDPYAGGGTVGEAAYRTGRGALLIERQPYFVALMRRRLAVLQAPLFLEVG